MPRMTPPQRQAYVLSAVDSGRLLKDIAIEFGISNRRVAQIRDTARAKRKQAVDGKYYYSCGGDSIGRIAHMNTSTPSDVADETLLMYGVEVG